VSLFLTMLPADERDSYKSELPDVSSCRGNTGLHTCEVTTDPEWLDDDIHVDTCNVCSCPDNAELDGDNDDIGSVEEEGVTVLLVLEPPLINTSSQ